MEPNFFNYQELLGKNRRATSINACYAMTTLPTMVDFVNAQAVSGIQGNCLMSITSFCLNLCFNVYHFDMNFYSEFKISKLDPG